MNKKKITLTSLSLMTGLTFLYGFSNESPEENFKVMSTSYSKPLTSIQFIENAKTVKTKQYKLAGVEKISDGMIFNKYGNTLIDLKSKDKSLHKIEVNSLNVKKIKTGFISLNNSNMNEFSITKYKKDFSKSQKTMRFVGDARDFLITDDKVYVLANIYGENTRDVSIYTVDLKTLKTLKVKKIKGLTFGFYFKKSEEKLNIYGNLTEEKEELAISSYSLDTEVSKAVLSSSIPVMWINKTKKISQHKELVLNTYSLLEIDYKANKSKIAYESNNNLIDFRYDALEKSYYILEGNFDKKTFQVTKLNKQMQKIKNFKIKPQDNTIPVKVLL